MHRASEDQHPRENYLDDAATLEAESKLSPWVKSLFQFQLGMFVFFCAIAVVGVVLWFSRTKANAIYDKDAVSIEMWNQGALDVLRSEQIGFDTYETLGQCTVKVKESDAKRTVDLMVADCKQRDYWLVVRYGNDTNRIYNKVNRGKTAEYLLKSTQMPNYK